MIAGLLADIRVGARLDEGTDWRSRAGRIAALPGVTRVRFGAATDAPETVVTVVDVESTIALDEVETAIRDADARDRELGREPAPGELLRHEFVADFLNEGYAPEAIGALQLVWMTPGDAAELARWYAEEHVALLFRVPGWLRTRRFRSTTSSAPDWLALHELATADVATDPSGGPARSTPWRNRIVAAAETYRRLTVELSRD